MTQTKFEPIESKGYWTAIFLFELWAAFAGIALGFQNLGAAGFFIGWNLVRLYLSPFLRFALMRSLPFLAATAGAFALGVSVLAGSSSDDQGFILTVVVLFGAPFVALFHLWKSTHFEALVVRFESTRDDH